MGVFAATESRLTVRPAAICSAPSFFVRQASYSLSQVLTVCANLGKTRPIPQLIKVGHYAQLSRCLRMTLQTAWEIVLSVL